MSTGDSASRPGSLWTSWLGGIKSAWTQVKLEYQQERKRKKTSNAMPSRSSNATRGRNSGTHRGRGRGRGRRAPSQDLRTQIMTAQHERQNQAQRSSAVDDSTPEDHEGPSILNASFLHNIRKEQTPEHKTKGTNVDASGSPSRKRKRDPIPPESDDSKENEAVDVSRSVSILSAAIDEEYVLRVQRRVQELEAELEAARLRLSLYENAAILAPPIQHSNVASRPQDSSDEQETNENESLTTETKGTMDAEDTFVLSPSKLQLSPIRVELADVSNGEMVRREAVAALKERFKHSLT